MTTYKYLDLCIIYTEDIKALNFRVPFNSNLYTFQLKHRHFVLRGLRLNHKCNAIISHRECYWRNDNQLLNLYLFVWSLIVLRQVAPI